MSGTFWMSASGTDTNSGTSYAQARKTLLGVFALVSGTNTTVNIVNDGDHDMLTAGEQVLAAAIIDGDSRCRGDAWTNPGLVIQGVDSSGNPAIATFVASGTMHQWLYFRDHAAFVTIQGIEFDYSAKTASTSSFYPIEQYGNGVVPARVYNCRVIGGAIGGASPAGARRLLFKSSGSDYTTETDGWEVAYCYFQNCPSVLGQDDNLYQPWNVHHNIFVWDTNDVTARTVSQIVGESATTYKTWSVSHNTFYLMEQETGQEITPPVNISTPNATNLSVHSNLLLVDVGTSANPSAPFSTHLFVDGQAASGSGTRGSMGYNAICSGTNVSASAGWGTCGYYDDIFNPDFPSYSATAVYASDLLTTNVTRSDVFNGTAAWTWTDPSGDGYSHDLPFDMRPIIARTLDINASPAGAVKAAITQPIDPGAGGDADEGSNPDQARNYIDSYPFYHPLLKATTEHMVRIRKNKQYDHVDLRHYLQDHVIDEHTSRVLQITGSTTKTVTLSGVQYATGVSITSDADIPVTVTYYNGATTATFTVVVSEALMLDQCLVTQLYFNNTASSTVTVGIVVFE